MLRGKTVQRRNDRSAPIRWLVIFAGTLALSAAFAALNAHPEESAGMEIFAVTDMPAKTQEALRLPNRVIAGLPAGQATHTLTFTREKLMAGHMLLVDETHPVPYDLSPATKGILTETGGRVSCRDASAVLAVDALNALDDMFRRARYDRHNTMVVFAGARSVEQQRGDLMDRMTVLSRSMSFEQALKKAKQEIELPGFSEHQLPWCVDIRICDGWNDLPREEPLNASEAGTWLINHSWEYGLIRRYPEAQGTHGAWHFRYVGRGHAAMIHALNVTFEEYLLVLREHRALTLLDESGQPAVSVICQPMADAGQTHLTLPRGADLEGVSADNDGWALAVCTY